MDTDEEYYSAMEDLNMEELEERIRAKERQKLRDKRKLLVGKMIERVRQKNKESLGREEKELQEARRVAIDSKEKRKQDLMEEVKKEQAAERIRSKRETIMIISKTQERERDQVIKNEKEKK